MSQRAYTNHDPEQKDNPFKAGLHPYLGRGSSRAGQIDPAGNPRYGSSRHEAKVRATDDQLRRQALDLLESMCIDREAPVWQRFCDGYYILVILILTDSPLLTDTNEDSFVDDYGKTCSELLAEKYA